MVYERDYHDEEYATPWVELYDRQGYRIGLFELCKYVLFHYPRDVFKEQPVEIVKLREACRGILEKVHG